MRIQSVVLVIFLCVPFAHGGVECIGPKNADKFIVYLHGIDSVVPSKQELANREVLSRLSEALKVRFAVPRASGRCPNNKHQLCWTWSAKTSAELLSVKSAIESAVNACFPSKSYDALGFSNGGIALASMLRLCEKVKFKSVITVGAAGAWYPSDPKNLRSCGTQLVSLLGTDDQANQKPVRDFVAHLISLNAPVELIEYDGGHALVFEPLYRLLSNRSSEASL